MKDVVLKQCNPKNIRGGGGGILKIMLACYPFHWGGALCGWKNQAVTCNCKKKNQRLKLWKQEYWRKEMKHQKKRNVVELWLLTVIILDNLI